MTITVGTPIDLNNFVHLTPGTTMSNAHGEDEYRLLEGGTCKRRRSVTTSLWQIAQGDYRVTAVGDEPVRQPTLVQFLQRLRTTTVGSSYQNSIPMEPVRRALAQLSVNDSPQLGVGMWVHAYDRELVARIGNRSGVTYEIGNPNWREGYGLFGSDRQPIMGDMSPPVALRVATMDNPDITAYLIDGTDADLSMIEAAKARAWTIGAKAKSENSWCEAYESAMGALGIGASYAVTAEVTPTVAAPMVLDGHVAARQEQMNLPDGAILMFPNTGAIDNHWCFLQRRLDGRHATSNLMGPNSGHHSDAARVLWDGTGEMRIPVLNTEMMDEAPAFTIITLLRDGGLVPSESYEKNPEGRWSSSRSGMAHPSSSFLGHGAEWVFTFFPLVTPYGALAH